ncbi:MAG: hypothetical protein MJZ66_06345 [Bacteroidales bacterium]|nr:hypothetical protein [Bacteroidales bacterium]MCQ2253786.1 hypothetical protein [Bacteroidales bacterium]
MTDEKKILISDLREKISQLLTISKREKDENASLREKNVELQRIIKEKEAEHKELQFLYDNLKSALSLMTKSEVHNTKIKLNRFVRDIEKCMSLLNK